MSSRTTPSKTPSHARSPSVASQRSSISQLAVNTSRLSLTDKTTRPAPPAVATRETLEESSDSSEDEMAPTSETAGPSIQTGPTGATFKVKDPDRFDGSTDKFKGFIVQLELITRLQPAHFKNETIKVLYAANLLSGKALTWFEPFLGEFFEKGNESSRRTRAIFSSLETFKNELRSFCGVQDQAKEAERKIQGLKQTASVAHYASQFRSIAVHLNWDDKALAFIFYQGLKDEVRARYIDKERPNSLGALIDDATAIDNRLMEFKADKGNKGTYIPFRQKANTSKPRFYGGPMPMDLDRAEKKRNFKPKFKGPISKAERDRRIKENLCLYCGGSGHSANACTKKGNKNPKRQFNMAEPSKKRVAWEATEEEQRLVRHAELAWTKCTRDACLIHLASKRQAGVFPTPRESTPAPVNRSICGAEGPAAETETMDGGKLTVQSYTKDHVHVETHYYRNPVCKDSVCTKTGRHRHLSYDPDARKSTIPQTMQIKRCRNRFCQHHKLEHFHDNISQPALTVDRREADEADKEEDMAAETDSLTSEPEDLQPDEDTDEEPEPVYYNDLEPNTTIVIDEIVRYTWAHAHFRCLEPECEFSGRFHVHKMHYDPRDMMVPIPIKIANRALLCRHSECMYTPRNGEHLHWTKNE